VGVADFKPKKNKDATRTFLTHMLTKREGGAGGDRTTARKVKGDRARTVPKKEKADKKTKESVKNLYITEAQKLKERR